MNHYTPDELNPRTPSNGQPKVRRPEDTAATRASNLPTGTSLNLTLRRYWAAVQSHWWHIAIFVIITVAVTGFILLRIPKEYKGTATIRIDPSVPVNVVGNQNGNSGGFTIGPQLATDMKEIVSPAVVTPAILNLSLWKPTANGSTGVPASLIGRVMGGISVNQVRGTYLLDVSYRCKSPSRAAAVANALAEQFIAHEYETRDNALLSLSQYMRKQIKELGRRMEKSQLSLDEFERSNNISNPEDTSGLLTKQLSFLEQELGQEQAQQRSLDANLALVKEGSLDALLVSDRGKALIPFIQAQQQAKLEFDALASKYGPGNYLYQQEKRKLARINHTVQKEEDHVAAQIKVQAKTEAVEVHLTTQKLAEVQAQLDQLNRETVQYQILKHKATSNQNIYDDLLQRVDAADVSAGYHSTALRIINPAKPDPVPVYPRIKLTLMLAALLAGFLGVVGAVAMGEMDRTIRDPGSVQGTLGVELLGFLPETQNDEQLKSLITAEDEYSSIGRNAFAESMLGIRSTLLLGDPDSPVRTAAVISCQPKEGKTTVAMNLAASFAALGKRTVLVDSDLLQPRVHRMLDVSNRVGLSSILQKQANLHETLRPGPINGLSVLPAGPPSVRARELLASQIDRVVNDLKSQFDIVVLDTPPVLGFADTLNVAAAVDALLLVVRAGKTPQEYVQVALEQLRQVRAPVAGIVLNGVKSQAGPYYHWYSDDHYREYATVNSNHNSSNE